MRKAIPAATAPMTVNLSHIKINFHVPAAIDVVSFVTLVPANCIARLHCHVASAAQSATTRKVTCLAILIDTAIIFFAIAAELAITAVVRVVANADAFTSTALVDAKSVGTVLSIDSDRLVSAAAATPADTTTTPLSILSALVPIKLNVAEVAFLSHS